MSEDRWSGRRVVGLMYVVTVVVIGLFGYLVGIAIQPRVPASTVGVGPLQFPFTPLNLAFVGMVLVGLALAVLFALVAAVSRYTDW